MLQRPTDVPVIVWETDRPNARAEVIVLVGDDQGNLTNRAEVTAQLRFILEEEDAYDDEFWERIGQLSDAHYQTFYTELVDRLSVSNLYIATHNVTVSFCTGSHNNFQLLGSLIQAKGAIFYICPYLGKSKFKLQQSLVILHQGLQHIKEHESQSESDRGTVGRMMKFLLQRAINQSNLKMELSQYQAVAKIYGLPSLLTSEKPTYGNPASDAAFRTQVQFQQDMRVALDRVLQRINAERDDVEYHSALEPGGSLEDFIVPDDPSTEDAAAASAPEAPSPPAGTYSESHLREEIGQTRIFAFEEELAGGQKRKLRTAVPVAALYANRGVALNDMNRHEYRALIGIRRKPKTTPQWPRAGTFQFDEGFLLHAHYEQYLLAKHQTPILTRPPPQHPGARPPEQSPSLVQQQWREKADVYASFFLSEFRPEKGHYGMTESD